MYKLFLCLRYLRSRVIAYFAVLGVALCVAMMLIAISVMDGFLRKIELAAKGLFGDIVVESTSLTGLGLYDEFAAELNWEMPELKASPFIITYGILRVPNYDYRTMIQIAGIRLPGRADVSDFEEGLFVQAGRAQPTWTPSIEQMQQAVRRDAEEIRAILDREQAAAVDGKLPAAKAELVRRLRDALSFHFQAEGQLLVARDLAGELGAARAKLDEAIAAGQDAAAIEQLQLQVDELTERSGLLGPEDRAILGLGIGGLSFRTDQGETIRKLLPSFKVNLVLAPLGRRLSATEVTPNQQNFTVVDDCRTDVASIDSEIVYIPFETLQRLNNMTAEYSADDPQRVVIPARCSQIHVKVPGQADERALEQTRLRVEALWRKFHAAHPEASSGNVDVLTWRQRQANVVGPIEKQRTLTMIMFGIISLVAVVLIFVIFYMIVFQKTKDIGVLKAIGASSGGVAWIFLLYGAAVGLVGSILGTVGGYYFVRYINPIQDWVDRVFGFRVWSREVFMFEKIPNEVDPANVVGIVIAAIAAGLVGALIPAYRAARMQPVEALRYE